VARAWSRRTTEAIPLDRLSQPDDLVGAVLFLTADEPRWITGSTVTVDGAIWRSEEARIGTGQVQRPTREEPEVGILQPEPPSMLAALPQTVPPSRGTSEPRDRAHHPIPKILRTRIRPRKPLFSAPLRQLSAKIKGLRWDRMGRDGGD